MTALSRPDRISPSDQPPPAALQSHLHTRRTHGTLNTMPHPPTSANPPPGASEVVVSATESPSLRAAATRIGPLRRSLRGPAREYPEPSPVEEYERAQADRGDAIVERIQFCILAWACAQAASIVILIFAAAWTEARPVWLSFLAVLPWLYSVVLASAAAWTAGTSIDLIQRRWLVAAAAPWGVLILEANLLLALLP